MILRLHNLHIISILKCCLVSSFLIFTSHLFSQAVTTEVCTCLENQNYQNGQNGQFRSAIQITSATGETWTLSSVHGIYMTTSVYPMDTIPFTDGFIITETVTTGIYNFSFVYIDNAPFSFTISNGVTSQTIASTDATYVNCRYPRGVISGDAYVCMSSAESYTVANSATATYNWSINGGGTLSSPTNTNAISVAWGATPGTYQLQLDITDTAANCRESNIYQVVVEEVIALACNNSINLTINDQCQLSLLPEMILESMDYENDSYTISLLDEETNTLLTNGMIGSTYVGKQLRVIVTQNCGNNACWGYATLKDESVPDISCPADITVNCEESTAPEITGLPDISITIPLTVAVLQSDGRYLLSNYDNCGDAYFSYTDVENVGDCSATFSKTITRTWVLSDTFGNSSTCNQMISVNRAVIADVTFPVNYDNAFDQTLHNPSLQSCGNDASIDPSLAWVALDNGHPSPESTGFPAGISCTELISTFEDVKIDLCGDKAFKILRTWRVQDHCTQEVRTSVQRIAIMDTIVPVVTTATNSIVNTANYTCTDTILVSPPVVSYECSSWSYTVAYRTIANGVISTDQTEGITQNTTTGIYSIYPTVPILDSVYVVRYVTDACGNTTESTYLTTIVDNIPPTPVCDQNTFVALNDNGEAYAAAETFDNGSSDNCGIQSMTLVRMSANGCTQPTDNSLVKFCCDDVGTVQMVQLTVIDSTGNTNFCMVEVEVQDNMAPVITCPADMTIDCSTQIGDLSVFGSASATDICNVSISESSNSLLDSCNKGTITRVFIATDAGGNSSSCTQVISVNNTTPFTINTDNPLDATDNVVWPLDLNLSGCKDTDITPEALSSLYSYPSIITASCTNIDISYEDIIFQNVEDVCYKVLRTWTIVDWCQYNPFTPTIGKWSYTQVIKLSDNVAPTISTGCSDSSYTINSTSRCDLNITISATGSDDCVNPENLTWYYSIDEGNDGSIQYSGVQSTDTRNISYGEHKICWKLTDDCSNTTECCNVITLNDNIAPTAYCRESVVSVLNNVNKSVTVWASDFNNGTFDNCMASNDISISFSSNVSDTQKTFTCSDITNGISQSIELDIWFTDAAGNQSFCPSTFILQDNNDSCPDIEVTNPKIALSGAIYTEDYTKLEDVRITLMDHNMLSSIYTNTTDNGDYAFQDLDMYGDFMLEPSKDTGALEGVSTLDLVIMQRHILGLELLDSPYKMIAADVNDSHNVSAIDLVQLRKLILGIYDELPDNSSYRFVEASQAFSDILNPFPFNERTELDQVSFDINNNNFIAVKIGDVNASISSFYNANPQVDNRSSNTIFLHYKIKYSEDQRQLRYEFYLPKSMNSQGFQIAFDINNVLNFESISSSSLQLDASNFAYFQEDNGVDRLHILWYDALHGDLDSHKALFSLDFTLSDENVLPGTDALRVVDSALFKSEVYNISSEGFTTTRLSLDTEYAKEDNTILIHQNIPNPFISTTYIGFKLSESAQVTLRVYDMKGREVLSRQAAYLSGYNEINIHAEDINQTGIFYYQLETDKQTVGKTMILLE